MLPWRVRAPRGPQRPGDRPSCRCSPWASARFDYGREPILAGVDLTLQPGVRYALVGPNGAGKTTLLAVLAGEAVLQGGRRQLTGRVLLRCARRDPGAPTTSRVRCATWCAKVAFPYELALQAELERVADALAHGPAAEHDALVTRQGRLQAEFERLDGYTLDARLAAALAGVGLPQALWDNPVASLSGGERRRAALAATLLGRADLLLLDEPTNHLDLTSCEWLENHLTSWPGAAVIISHDRWFLDRVARRTLHLERGRLVDYGGNYTYFHAASEERRRQDLAAWQRQQDHIRQTEAFIRKNIEGQKTKQAQARRKQLAKLDRVDRPGAEPTGYNFLLRPVRDSGGTVLQAEGLAKSFGARALFADLDLLVVRGERIGIIGPNGCGKTTLLHILAGRVAPDRGQVSRGHNVDLGIYDQNLATVSDHNTVLGEIQSVDPAAQLGELRSFLAAFGFGEDLIDRPVGSLSGGERGRLALLRLIKEGHNTLLLDEPTNHLDIQSRESLEAALADFSGTVIMVSHDRRFLDDLVDRLVVFPSPGAGAPSPRVFLGNYADWIRKRDEEDEAAASAPADRRPAAPPPDTPSGTVPTGLSKNEAARRRAWIADVEAAIEALESEKAAALDEMSAADCTNLRRRELASRCAAIEDELAEAFRRWEAWHAELEGTSD
ncbi:MAG: ABC-F family ATP-binding cassette domain-containing protein [Candidatus Krumholzibacteriia bacterium]